MPTYLCHGFRWHRGNIRTFVIVHDLGDVSADWIINSSSSATLLSELSSRYDFIPRDTATPAGLPPFPAGTTTSAATAANDHPDHSSQLPHHDENLALSPSGPSETEEDAIPREHGPVIRLLEEFDPADLDSPSRPYAYVADYVVRIDLSARVAQEMGRYEDLSQRWKMGPDGQVEWFTKLRDKLQNDEDIAWYVVVCGDEERAVPEHMGQSEMSDVADSEYEQMTGQGAARAALDHAGSSEKTASDLLQPPTAQGRELEHRQRQSRSKEEYGERTCHSDRQSSATSPRATSEGHDVGEREGDHGSGRQGHHHHERNRLTKTSKPTGLRKLFGKKGS